VAERDFFTGSQKMKTHSASALLVVGLLLTGCTSSNANDPAAQFKCFVAKARKDLKEVNDLLEEFSIGREKQDVANMKLSYEIEKSVIEGGQGSATLNLEIHNVLRTNYWWTYKFNYEYRGNKWMLKDVKGIEEVNEEEGHKQYVLPPNLVDDDLVKCFTP
jgi:hypothetical protein